MDDVTVTTMKFRISTSHPLYEIPYTRKCVYIDVELEVFKQQDFLSKLVELELFMKEST